MEEIKFKRKKRLSDEFLKYADMQEKLAGKNEDADASLVFKAPRDIWSLSEDGLLERSEEEADE